MVHHVLHCSHGVMAMNLELVDKEIERLEDLKHLKRILSDPKMAELAEKVFVSQNGSGRPSSDVGRAQEKPKSQNPRESEADAVRRAITKMEGELTVSSVADKVRESGR